MASQHSAQVIEMLAYVGADQNRRRAFDFYLYFPEQRDAAAAGRELAEAGFRCQVRPSLGGQWLCLVAGRLVPDDAALETVFHLMETTAEDFGGAFDGWETQVKLH